MIKNEIICLAYPVKVNKKRLYRNHVRKFGKTILSQFGSEEYVDWIKSNYLVLFSFIYHYSGYLGSNTIEVDERILVDLIGDDFSEYLELIHEKGFAWVGRAGESNIVITIPDKCKASFIFRITDPCSSAGCRMYNRFVLTASRLGDAGKYIVEMVEIHPALRRIMPENQSNRILDAA